MKYLILIAAYTIASIGLAVLISIAAFVWYYVLNHLYKTLKANHRVFEFLLYRKEFKRWYKEHKSSERKVRK